MKVTIIVLLLLIVVSCLAEPNASCNSLRIGTKKEATDIMLDGEPTDRYKLYRAPKDDNDVDISSDTGQGTFYVFGIDLEKPLDVDVTTQYGELLSATTSVTGDDANKSFEVKVDYQCTDGLSGISEVFFTLTLDGNTCGENKFSVLKKCGAEAAYAPLEISELTYWGMSKKVLTDNGGRTSNSENLFDSTQSEAIVIDKGSKDLTFRVKNVATDSKELNLQPPIVRTTNKGENVVYPVLRGAGARFHHLKPGEYKDFKLEFNCISLEKDSESLELVFRPNFHNKYIFRMTKECEGLTAAGLISKEFQDSVVFDFFAFLFFLFIFLAILTLLAALYVKYKQMYGEDIDFKSTFSMSWENIKNFMESSGVKKISSARFSRESPARSTFDTEDIEETPLSDNIAYNPKDVLKTKS